LAAVAVALAVLVGGCGGGASTTGGMSTPKAESEPGPYDDMERLATAFQARLERENPHAFIVEVICVRTGHREAECNVREDEQTKGYPIRISADGDSFNPGR
jgi:hypothetical protein